MKYFLERDIVGLKPGSGHLVYLASEADCDEEIKLPVTTLKSCPHTKLLTGLADTHIYLISFSLLSRLIEASTERYLNKLMFTCNILNCNLHNYLCVLNFTEVLSTLKESFSHFSSRTNFLPSSPSIPSNFMLPFSQTLNVFGLILYRISLWPINRYTK